MKNINIIVTHAKEINGETQLCYKFTLPFSTIEQFEKLNINKTGLTYLEMEAACELEFLKNEKVLNK